MQAQYTTANIENLVLSHNQVLSVKSFSHDNTTIIAIIPTTIFLKSERDILLDEIAALVEDQIDGDIIVTYSTEIYRKIDQDLSDSDKQDLVKLLS